VRGRRSYRHYTAENVDRMLISRLIATIENAPTGVNVRDLTFTLIDDIDAMRRFQSLLIAGVRSDRSGSMLPERYSKLRELSDDQMIARIFRCAPHAIIVSSPPSAPCASEDTALTIAYFDLLAQSAGLGCVWWGMLRYFASAMPQIKAALGLPEDHIYSAALFGYPAIKYARTANRDGSATIRRLTAADFRESE